MLQVRASPSFLPSTTSSSPSSASQAQAQAPSASFGRGSHRRGGLVSLAAAASPRRGAARRSVMAAAGAAKLEDADALIDSVETFIFDCDGVIWKGDKLIDGVPETLDLLRSKGKRLVFVTNNSTKSRKQYGKKFETLGLSVDEEEIFASSFAAAAYLQSIDFPKDKKVYVIGEEGILKELELAGFQYLGGPTDGDKKIELKPGFYMEHDKDVGAVVVGFDRYFNYYKVQFLDWMSARSWSMQPMGWRRPTAAFQNSLAPVPDVNRRAADRDGSGMIDDKELQSALSGYNQSFSLRTVHLLMYLFTNTNVRKIGPKEFTSVFYSLQNWRSIFERFDRDRSGKIDSSELRDALLSLGYSVSPTVLDLLVSKFDKTGGKNRAIEYDNFIEPR